MNSLQSLRLTKRPHLREVEQPAVPIEKPSEDKALAKKVKEPTVVDDSFPQTQVMSYRKSSHRSAPSKSKANKVPLAMTDSASMDSSHKGFLIEANPVNQDALNSLVTIYGFTEGDSGSLMSLFHRDGVILSSCIGPTGRWIVIQYSTEDAVLAALARHGSVLNGIMVGVARTRIEDITPTFLESAAANLVHFRSFENSSESNDLQGKKSKQSGYKPIGGPYWSRSRWEESDPNVNTVTRKHSFCSFLMEWLGL